ncbi:MAG: LamG domain-containing protein [Bacteriovoracaceae bacterium]|nr:LamG domain-containing protein [Bacteriovoracaceae bacterium]
MKWTFFLIVFLFLTSCGQEEGLSPTFASGCKAISSSWAPAYDNIKFYIDFDGSGTLANNSSITANIGTNLTAKDGSDGSLTYSTGVVNQALLFDGSDDYLEQVSDDDAMDITGDLTIVAWVKISASGSTQSLIMKGDFTLNDVSYNVRPFTTVTLITDDHSGLGLLGVGSTDTYSLDSWAHIAVVRKIATNSINFYINGRPDTSNSQSNPHNSLENTTQKMVVGAILSNGAFSAHFKGLMDELAVWDTALTDAQIESIYNAQSICF